MKKITIIGLFLMFGCATSSNITPEPKSQTNTMIAEIVEAAKDPKSFAHCMRYDENITLTAKEELALLEHCLGL